MKQVFYKIKYPKFSLLLLTIIIAAFVFNKGGTYPAFHDFLISLGYFGDFIGGFFYAFGLTSAPATAVLLVLAKGQNIFLAGLIGGIGALLGDILIYLFIKLSFTDEINHFKQEKLTVLFKKVCRKVLGRFYVYFLPCVAGILIASPLPTEVGVSLLAALKEMTIKKFILLAFLLHTIGIFCVLIIGNAL